MNNRIIKIFILLITCLLIFGCKKDEEKPVDEEPIDETKVIKQNLKGEDIGTVVGEYSNRFTLIKVTNNNDKDVYVSVKLTYFDSYGQVDEDEEYVYVGAKKSVYAVSKMFGEDPLFTRYTYEIDLINEINNYNDILNNIKITHQNTGSNMIVTMVNEGKRTTTPSALLLYYKDNKIVAVSESIIYDLMPTSSRSETLELPHKDLDTLIPFDRVEVFVNEVSVSL